jgi:methylated-DNA-[protein]-cysteine S-methyltransferase
MACTADHVPLEVRTPAGAVTVRARDGAEAEQLRGRIGAYLAGANDDFGDVPLPAGTDFHRACWQACRTIPRGETRSYAWLAAAAGSPGAARAAGQAMRRNPMPIVVPCHRVVGAGRWIGGYSGEARADGPMIGIKMALLQLEAGHADVPSHPHIGTPRRATQEISGT